MCEKKQLTSTGISQVYFSRVAEKDLSCCSLNRDGTMRITVNEASALP